MNETLDKIKKRCEMFDYQNQKLEGATDEECMLAAQMIELATEKNVEALISNWLNPEEKVGVIAVTLLAMYNLTLRTTLLMAEPVSESLTEYLHKLLDHNVPIIRLRTLACITFAYSSDILSKPKEMSVALEARLLVETDKYIKDEIVSLLSILPPAGKMFL